MWPVLRGWNRQFCVACCYRITGYTIENTCNLKRLFRSTGLPKLTVSEVINEPEDSLLLFNKGKILKGFLDNPLLIGFPTHACKWQVDNNPRREMVITKETVFLRRPKVSTSTREQIPKDWCELAIAPIYQKGDDSFWWASHPNCSRALSGDDYLLPAKCARTNPVSCLAGVAATK